MTDGLQSSVDVLPRTRKSEEESENWRACRQERWALGSKPNRLFGNCVQCGFHARCAGNVPIFAGTIAPPDRGV